LSRGNNVGVDRRGPVGVVIAALLLAGCGDYARNNKESGPTTTSIERVGSGLDALVGKPTSTAVPTSSNGAQATTPTSSGLAANQSRYVSPEGFELTLTVAGQLRYGSGDDIKLQLTARNVSKRDLQFDPNDLRNFAIRTLSTNKTAWTDGNCSAARVPKAVETRAQTLHPNEQSEFVDTYPGPAEMANRDDCRVGPGTYSVFGFVTWCPPGSTDDRGVCDATSSRQITSAGVKITIT
jgi:hypothetical protein